MSSTTSPSEYISYAHSPAWADITPIPLNDAPNLPGISLAAIHYPEHYAEAMSYLRAVMAANEVSERALALTEDIIASNPAHYTVWLYRMKIVTELDVRNGGKEVGLEERLRSELDWVERQAETTLKNYQIWYVGSPPASGSSFFIELRVGFCELFFSGPKQFDLVDDRVWLFLSYCAVADEQDVYWITICHV